MECEPIERGVVCPDCGEVCIITAKIEFSLDADGFMRAGVTDLNTDAPWAHYADKHMTVQGEE